MLTQELSISAPRTTPANVTVSTSTAQSAALEAGNYVFVCDVACRIVFGSNPSATANHLLVPAATMLRIAGVQANEKCAIIATGAGTAQLYPAI